VTRLAVDVSFWREPEARERVRRGGNLGTSGLVRTMASRRWLTRTCRCGAARLSACMRRWRPIASRRVVRKSVRFEIAALPFIIQISGTQAERLRLATAPGTEHW